jgi:hypothetical protein
MLRLRISRAIYTGKSLPFTAQGEKKRKEQKRKELKRKERNKEKKDGSRDLLPLNVATGAVRVSLRNVFQGLT